MTINDRYRSEIEDSQDEDDGNNHHFINGC